MTDRTLGSRYLLDEQIGAGGMGVVWRGRDRFTEARYAIKLLRPEFAADPEAVARFVRERNTLVRFRHPSVVTLHDMIVEGDQLALVMDLVDGGDLDAWRQRCGGALAPADAVELAAQICEGLAAAHAAGIVHRDLKPANVLLDHGRVKLADFGIARSSGDTSMTATGMVLGTAAYLAPELLADGDPSSASDVYAFGITLYELLTGKPPFGGNVANIMRGHLNDMPALIPGIPDRLWTLITACLAKQPAARPGTAALARALRDPALLREPVPAPAFAPAARSFTPAGPSFGPTEFSAPVLPTALSAPPAETSFAPHGPTPPRAFSPQPQPLPQAQPQPQAQPGPDPATAGPPRQFPPPSPGLLKRFRTISFAIGAAVAVVLVTAVVLAAAQIGPFGSTGPVTGAGATQAPANAQSPTPAVSVASTASTVSHHGASRHRSSSGKKASASASANASKSATVQRSSPPATRTSRPPASLTAYGPNLLADGDFSAPTLIAWNYAIFGAVLRPQAGPDNENAVALTASPQAGLIQVVAGLTPGAHYLVTGWVKVDLGKIFIGAADNDAGLTKKVAAGGAVGDSWKYLSVIFTPGAGQTSAQVFCAQATGNGFCANMSFRAMH